METVVHAGALIGIEAFAVKVEAQLTTGLPGCELVGLPERAVKESRVRVKAALQTAGFDLPPRRIVVNLAPGDLRKQGAGFDLAVAIAVLAACEAITLPRDIESWLMLGELSLSGEIRRVTGTLAQLRGARERGLRHAIIPKANEAEGALLEGLDVRCAARLGDVLDHLTGVSQLPLVEAGSPARGSASEDLCDVRGQLTGKRALEIAAAGGHGLLFIGPPGAGKTMLARRLAGLLPDPTTEEALEIATIASAAGRDVPAHLSGVHRPFRAPHHSATAPALVGGGDPVMPGEVTLAHRGVLFLDELPEFRRDAIESLRTTMETGIAEIARANCRARLPAKPLIVAAMNPCPCGYATDRERLCSCSPERVERYRARISGPLLDRFDLHVAIPRMTIRALRNDRHLTSSSDVRARVIKAKEWAAERSAPRGAGFTGLLRRCSPKAARLAEDGAERLGLSARGATKALQIAHTLANLDAAERVLDEHVIEALHYRLLDRRRRPGRNAGHLAAL